MGKTWIFLLAFLPSCYLALVTEVKPFQTCERRYTKVGCFKESASGLYLKQLAVYARVEKGQLNWTELAKSLHSLACRCEAKAREANYAFFSIRFYGECWIGNVDPIMLDSSEAYSNTCIDSTYQRCSSNQVEECAGAAHSDYIYKIPNVTEWAQGRPTQQSSTAFKGVSSRAVDGNDNGNFQAKSCSHTDRENNPWWMVDLGHTITVEKVIVTNRGDCCYSRLAGYQIWLSSSKDIVDEKKTACALNIEGNKKGNMEVKCQGRPQGRYLFIVIPKYQYLALCEVRVYGYPSEPRVSTYQYQLASEMAQGKPTDQSSTNYDGVSSRAVDGNSNPIYAGNSCTHTDKQQNPWWMVDLQQTVKVDKVRVSNRGDCCFERLNNFRVWLSNSKDPSDKAIKVCAVDQTISRSESKYVKCQDSAIGRYLYIGLPKTEYLTLCEVQVFGFPSFLET